jgi:hypothetical protein
MKKPLLAIVTLMAALVCLIFALHRERDAPIDEVRGAAQERSAAPAADAAILATRRPVQRTEIRKVPRAWFGPELTEQTAEVSDEATKPPPVATRARDGYYDKLLLKQGRDQAKEEQLVSRLMKTFGDRPDTLVGAISCSAEFCRVDLRGDGQLDVRERWQGDLFAAVEPKGLKFFIVASDDDGNTLASCYFGRDESWTVPDFHALGLL